MRIDPTDIAQMYLSGAALGTQQFGQLANIAQNRAALQQRQAEFAADEEQRAWSRGMDEQQLGLNIADYEQRAQVQAWREQQAAEKLQRDQMAANALGDVILRRFHRAPKPEAMAAQAGGVPDLAAQRAQGREKAAQMQQAYQPNPMQGAAGFDRAVSSASVKRFDPMPQADPMDEAFLDGLNAAVAAGDVETVKTLGTMVDDAEKRRQAMAQGDMLNATLGPRIAQIVDPTDKALAYAALYAKDFKGAIQILKDEHSDTMDENRLVAALMGTNAKLTEPMARNFVRLKKFDEGMKYGQDAKGAKGQERANSVAGVYDRLAAQASRVPSGKAVKPEQRSATTRLLEASATARANPESILPDGSILMDGGKVGRDGFIRVQRPDGREERISPEQFAQEAAPAMLQSGGAPSAGGAVPDLASDPDVIMQRILEQNPNATDEEIAAELQRRGFTAGE